MNIESLLFKAYNIPIELRIFFRGNKNPFRKVPVKRKRFVRKMRIEIELGRKIVSLYTPTALYSEGFLNMMDEVHPFIVDEEKWVWSV